MAKKESIQDRAMVRMPSGQQGAEWLEGRSEVSPEHLVTRSGPSNQERTELPSKATDNRLQEGANWQEWRQMAKRKLYIS